MPTSSIPRLLISAVSSGSGKTTITSGLLRCLARRGLKVVAYKCGPDYIDPMFHRSVLGTPCRNLDLFFSTEEQIKTLLGESSQQADIAVLEGVMGYYDGVAGKTDQASAYHLASATDTPTVLIADGRGTSLTLAAVVKGIIDFREKSQVAGVIINRCSKSAYMLLAGIIQDECGVPVLGYIPADPDMALESRHLGLVTAGEVEDLQQRIDRAADALEETVDIDALVQLAQGAPDIFYEPAAIEKVATNAPVIAVAQDDAFCFYYDESLETLRRMGAQLIEFSPLSDVSIPEQADAIYLGGGYPELHAERLAVNESMRASVKEAFEAGMPLFAECGGFLYLKESLTDVEGNTWPMAGVLKGGSCYTGKLSRFGYVEMTALRGSLIADEGETFKAHEFHYYDCEENGESFHAQKPLAKRNWDCGITASNLYAGFPHLYFPSCLNVARKFVTAAARFKEARS